MCADSTVQLISLFIVQISYKLTNFLEWFIPPISLHKILISLNDVQPTEKINVKDAKANNPLHKNITFHIFIQIFTPSRKIDHLSDEHHMHKYGFLILFRTYSAVVFKTARYQWCSIFKRETTKASHCVEHHQFH